MTKLYEGAALEDIRPNLKPDPNFTGIVVFTIALNESSRVSLALDSLRAQRNKDWRHVFGDNLSSDATVENVLSHGLEPRRIVVRWKRRTSSTVNLVRTARTATHLFPNARFFHSLHADDFFYSPNFLNFDEIESSDSRLFLPSLYHNSENKPIRFAGLLGSRFAAIRALGTSSPNISHLVHSAFDRTTFLKYLDTFERFSIGEPEDDLLVISLLAISYPMTIEYRSERIERLPRNVDNWYSWHAQKDQGSTPSPSIWRRSGLFGALSTLVLVHSPSDRAFRFLLIPILIRLPSQIANFLYLLSIQEMRKLIETLLSPFGLTLIRKENTNKLAVGKLLRK